MRKWFLLGFLVILPACAEMESWADFVYSLGWRWGETRVHVSGGTEITLMVMEKCPDLTITGRKAAADYTMSVVTHLFSRPPNQSLNVYTAKGDVIFSETSKNLTAMVLRACETIDDW